MKKKNCCDVATNEKVEQKVLTNQVNCDSEIQRAFDERYQLKTGNDLFVDIMECLKNNIKNVDKTSAIIKLLNGCGI